MVGTYWEDVVQLLKLRGTAAAANSEVSLPTDLAERLREGCETLKRMVGGEHRTDV